VRPTLEELLESTTAMIKELDTIDGSTDDVLHLGENRIKIEIIMKTDPQNTDSRVSDLEENLSALKAKYGIW
jgi:hypothetical protein